MNILYIYIYIYIIIIELSLVKKTVLDAHSQVKEQCNAKRESMKDYKHFFYQYINTQSFMSLPDNHQLKIVTNVQIKI